jgi:hypothetical protein
VSILPDDPMDLDDAAWGYGPCEVGDVQGPWLLFDLVAAMKPLELTAADSAGFAGDRQEGAGYFGDPPDDNLAHAKADAEAAFAACEPEYGGGLSAGTVTYPLFTPSIGLVGRNEAHGSWSVPGGSAPLVYDIDIYAIASAAPPFEGVNGTFNGNGDFDAADEDVLTLCTSDAGCTDRSGQSAAVVGSHTALPAWPPSDPGNHGYYVSASFGVVKWHFTHEA